MLLLGATRAMSARVPTASEYVACSDFLSVLTTRPAFELRAITYCALQARERFRNRQKVSRLSVMVSEIPIDGHLADRFFRAAAVVYAKFVFGPLSDFGVSV